MSLTLRDVGVAYDGAPFIEGLDLDLADGSITALLGPSGSGKSTLLRAIAGLEPATGEIAWDGRDLARVPTHRRGFALMFQDGQLFDHLTVSRNVAYGLPPKGRLFTSERALADQRKVDQLLELVGLSGYGGRNPATLSGGERQRVALARALAVDPRLLLLDEPLSSLDASLRERLAGDLRDILHAAGTTALLVTHDQEEAFAIADRIALMREGDLVQTGTLEDVWAHPADAEAALFLGYARVLGPADAEVLLPASEGGLDGAQSALAVRRSALVLDDAGPIEASVIEARATPEQVRLVVEVGVVGRLDAVAPLGARPAPGSRIRLRLDRAKTSVLTNP